MTDDNTLTRSGTEQDLKDAENAMVAAVDDPAARALAMRRHVEATRNLMQTAIVPSFERAVGALLDKSAASVIAEVHISIEQMTALVQEVLVTAREALSVSKENGRGLKKATARIARVEKRVGILEANNHRLETLEAAVRRLEARGDGDR